MPHELFGVIHTSNIRQSLISNAHLLISHHDTYSRIPGRVYFWSIIMIFSILTKFYGFYGEKIV